MQQRKPSPDHEDEAPRTPEWVDGPESSLLVAALGRVKWIPVCIASFVSFVFGALWFTAFFGDFYPVVLGRQNQLPQDPAPIFIVGPLVCTVVTTITSAILIRALKIDNLSDAVKFGALVGFGYLVSTMTNTAINPNMPHPLLYSLLSGPFFFLSGILASVILVLFR